MANFVLVEKLRIRFIPDGSIYTAQLVKEDHDVSLRID